MKPAHRGRSVIRRGWKPGSVHLGRYCPYVFGKTHLFKDMLEAARTEYVRRSSGEPDYSWPFWTNRMLCSRGSARFATTDTTKVTCKNCLRIIKEQSAGIFADDVKKLPDVVKKFILSIETKEQST